MLQHHATADIVILSEGQRRDANREPNTLVMTTISSRGRLSFLIAFPRTTSESPLEYTYAGQTQQSRVGNPSRTRIHSQYRMFECRDRNCSRKVTAVPSQGNKLGAGYSRKLDVLDRLLFRQHPVLPLGRSIRHTAQDDLRDFQSRIAETD